MSQTREIGREFRQTWIAKMDDTTRSIRQALERARAQKQSSVQGAAVRGEILDQRLSEMLQAEVELLGLKQEIGASSWK